MVYEFRCRSCEEPFEVHATLAEKERGLSPRCPHCGSAEVRRVFGAFMVLRSGASAASATSSASGGCSCGGACSCAPARSV